MLVELSIYASTFREAQKIPQLFEHVLEKIASQTLLLQT